MDEMLLWLILCPIAFMVIVFVVFYFIGIYNTRNIFMVDELSEYGGTITYQGVEFIVQRHAQIDVHYSGIVVHNPNGTMRAFKTVNPIFSQAPVITIGYRG